jgi:ATP-dependent Clp protease ATP-binding subunit ClpA
MEDFEWSVGRLREQIFGHDMAIDALVMRVSKNALVRTRSESVNELPPLGVFLLAGRRGIGKRLLATRLGDSLFDRGGQTVLDMKDYGDGDTAVTRLFGSAGQDGDLVLSVKRCPYHTLVLENIECASAKVQESLQSVIGHGTCLDPLGGGRVSFHNCVIVMTTTVLPPTAENAELPSREAMIDYLVDQTGSSAALFNRTQECLILRTPDDPTKAKVILQLLLDECQKYRLTLDYVEPEIVVREVARFSESCGFEYSKIRITRWLRDPIHLAASHGLDSVVLTSDLIDQENLGTALTHPEPNLALSTSRTYRT